MTRARSPSRWDRKASRSAHVSCCEDFPMPAHGVCPPVVRGPSSENRSSGTTPGVDAPRLILNHCNGSFRDQNLLLFVSPFLGIAEQPLKVRRGAIRD